MPLYDWHALIDATVDRMHVACPSREQQPVMRWETLIGRAVREGFSDADGQTQTPGMLAAYQVESAAKVQVAQVLGNASADYPNSTRPRIPLDDRWGCVISLNFDHAWRPGLTRRSLKVMSGYRKAQHRRPCHAREEVARVQSSIAPDAAGTVATATRLWFPNGSILRPNSIRMGLHDYGAAPADIRASFTGVKAWERVYLGVEGARQRAGFTAIAAALQSVSEQKPNLLPYLGVPTIPLSWVTEFLYRPLYFAGVGLLEQESGLWWLLAQRALNLAGVAVTENARVQVLVHRDDCSAFWATRPFGIETIKCNHWDEGWHRMLATCDQAS